MYKSYFISSLFSIFIYNKPEILRQIREMKYDRTATNFINIQKISVKFVKGQNRTEGVEMRGYVKTEKSPYLLNYNKHQISLKLFLLLEKRPKIYA